MVWLLVYIVPLLSMGLLAQEWATGTIETLMTAPVAETDVVMGKFLGSFAFFLVMLAPTLLYVVMLAIYANPRMDFGPIRSGYLGDRAGGRVVYLDWFVLLIADPQPDRRGRGDRGGAVRDHHRSLVGQRETALAGWTNVLNQTVFKRYTDFSRGIIDSGHLAFFILSTAVFLFLTTKVLESRRWK